MQLATVIGLLVAGESVALAQHHHHGTGSGDSATDMPAEPTLHLHGGIHLEAGTVEAFGADRHYQGLGAMLGGERDRVSVMLHLPVYRIELGGGAESGVGDLHLAARYVATRRWRADIGVSAGVMAPTGDDAVGIGMGHWMLMAGGFARRSFDRLATELTVGYAGATTTSGHAEHGVDVWPPVAPMNAQELRATARVGHPIWRRLGATLSGAGAVPLGEGAAIAVVGGELTLALSPVSLAVGVRQGLAAHTLHRALMAGVAGMF